MRRMQVEPNNVPLLTGAGEDDPFPLRRRPDDHDVTYGQFIGNLVGSGVKADSSYPRT
jgi:hypothetical protein